MKPKISPAVSVALAALAMSAGLAPPSQKVVWVW